jgi:hypothetical protein
MRKLPLIILAAVIVIISPLDAYSTVCGCTSQYNAFRKSHAVFVGQFIEYGDTSQNKGGPHPIKFKVEKMWKGKIQPAIIIYTYHLGDPKMMDVFELGHKYLVYAYGKKLLAGINCGPSEEIITDVTSAYYKEQVERLRNLDRFWFRLFSRLWPFPFPC